MWLGSMASLRIFPQANDPVFLQCSLWGIWIQDVFGMFVFLSTLILRYVRLLAFTRFRINLKGWKIWGIFLIVWSPVWIFAIVCSALQANGPIIDGNGFEVCYLQDPAMFAIIGLAIGYACGMVIGMVLLRKIKDRFLGEYKNTLWASIYAIVVMVIHTIILVLNLHHQIWGRILNSVIVTSISAVYVGVSVGYPAYKWYCCCHLPKTPANQAKTNALFR